ncbi:Crp/Fnr family transcriptional regulator [Membranihabitans marinus]|uniref:Crp/Fnr family transcriptional regulator n=1 Tax=Membranihabitans marinus TaxID=1227546 RepID=UPI001F194902|nr:Crp/Fnr family transcriptional regulator [Membranihabitans marinus]
MIKNLIKAKFKNEFEDGLLDVMVEEGRFVELNKGDNLINAGEFIRNFPLILTGVIKIMREDEEGKEILLYYLYPGETCALSLSCCMASKVSSIKAVVEDDAEVILIPIQKMDEWVQSFPTWKSFVMQTYQDRFEELLETIDELAFNKMDERLWSYLVNRTTVLQASQLDITHSEIAKELGTSREVISRLLKKLEGQNKIAMSRNSIEVFNVV